MYRCEICQQLIGPSLPAAKVAVETRARVYPARKGANRFKHKGKQERADDPGGAGFETVREVTACPECALAHAPDPVPSLSIALE